jgi:3-isopropylmalate/(R)-2-methylmalate dehydratase large subunit
MGRTLCQKVLDAHALDEGPGLYRRVRIDALLGHDATVALLIDEFERRGLSVWDVEKVIFTNDHFSPPATIERAEISRKFITFGRKLQLPLLKLDRGICHQLLVESPLCVPGALIVGADSHTITAGGIGACATGMGSTDILFALATGTTWMRSPPTLRVVLRGTLSDACSGRDIVLELLRRLGEDGAQYLALELHDGCEPRLSQDDRFAISNMAVEAGAKFGVFVPDEITLAYCEARDGRAPIDCPLPDGTAEYAGTLELDVAALSPRVAKPWSPSNVVGIEELPDTPLTMAFLGSCSSGRLQDLRDAAHEHVRMVVIPASVAVYQQAMQAGYVQTLSAAGAIVSHSSCGPCGGIDKGVLAADDVCVSTSNRNFRGRMGHWESQTYLASARTVARAAIAGRIHAELYRC